MATKKELISLLNNKINYLSKEDLNSSISILLEYLKEELADHNRIEIRGFGSFSVRDRRYAKQTKKYKTIYYRMAKAIATKINNI